MRKILITTTALVAFGLTNAAVAETISQVDKGIAISGSDKFACHSWADDVDDTSGANNSKNERKNTPSLAYNGVTDSERSISIESAMKSNLYVFKMVLIMTVMNSL